MKTQSLFLLMAFSSCNLSAQKPAESELKQTLLDAQYDKKVLINFNTYQLLATVLNNNIDTILANAENKNTVLKGLPYFDYVYNSVIQNTNIKDLPQFVYLQVDSLWKIAGENNIINLTLYKDKTITINTRIEKKPHNTIIVHQLIWNIKAKNNNHSFELVKDTTLNNNCIYRLGVSQDHGGW